MVVWRPGSVPTRKDPTPALHSSPAPRRRHRPTPSSRWTSAASGRPGPQPRPPDRRDVAYFGADPTRARQHGYSFGLRCVSAPAPQLSWGVPGPRARVTGAQYSQGALQLSYMADVAAVDKSGAARWPAASAAAWAPALPGSPRGLSDEGLGRATEGGNGAALRGPSVTAGWLRASRSHSPLVWEEALSRSDERSRAALASRWAHSVLRSAGRVGCLCFRRDEAVRRSRLSPREPGCHRPHRGDPRAPRPSGASDFGSTAALVPGSERCPPRHRSVVVAADRSVRRHPRCGFSQSSSAPWGLSQCGSCAPGDADLRLPAPGSSRVACTPRGSPCADGPPGGDGLAAVPIDSAHRGFPRRRWRLSCVADSLPGEAAALVSNACPPPALIGPGIVRWVTIAR